MTTTRDGRAHARSFARSLLIVAFVLAVAARADGPPLPVDPPRGDMRIVVFGDFNGSYGSTIYPAPVARAIEAIATVWKPDLLLSPGDVVAGQNDSLPDAAFAAMWAAFDERIALPLRAAGIPYAVAMGNHDASSLGGATGVYRFARERRAARAYWGRPMYERNLDYVDRDRHPFDYAFRAGEAFVAMIDASSATVSQEQRRWLEAVLRSPAATSARLRLVVGHLPLAPVGRGRQGPGETLADAEGLRRIMERGEVDLYVSGHHAAYYPGRLGNLELLFAGGVGGRPLLAGDAPARSTVTVVDVAFDPVEVRYRTFDLGTMQLVSVESLPRAIGSGPSAVRLSERAGATFTVERR